VFYACSAIGGLAALIGIVATLSGSWTPLIANDSGSVSVGGATVYYGTWFYLVGGIALLSLLIAVALYAVGRRVPTAATPAPDLAVED
jgi:hypothetical protein